MNHHREKVYFLIFLAMLGIIIASVYAGGPLAVTGVDADQPGQPYRWILNPIPYRTDQGGLGNQSNTDPGRAGQRSRFVSLSGLGECQYRCD